VNAPIPEKHIGQYRILRTLGAGGMGTVFLGEHLLLGRRAAIKTLLPALSSHREIVDRFFNEARAISTISDPGVVQIFDFGYHVDGTAYIVMEYLEGESLSARLDRLGTLRVVDALRLARQLASSLGAAHDRGIVHRDLKPGNVFLVRDGEVPGGERTKILDFGICKLAADPDNALTTQTGTMLGTPVYMSPEQCRGAGNVDHRSDIYSLGCVLFHMVAGRPPFDCDSVGEFIASHLKEDPPSPTSVLATLPREVDELMALCLAKDPDQRFQSMGEVQNAIEQVLARVSDNGSVPAPTPRQIALGEGFQSAFHAAEEQREITPSPAARSWFVDSLAPVEITGNYELDPPRLGWGKRIAMMLALVLGIAGGVAGTNYALANHATTDAPAPDVPALSAVETPAPLEDASVAQETAPPITDQIASDEPATDDTAAQPAPAAKPVVHQQARATRAPTSNRSRHVERASQPEQSTNEDLYDTR